MKRLSTFMGKLALLMLGVCFFAACSDDDGPSYSTATVQNSELLSILKDAKYGLTFNENGNLLLDDAAKNITKLDLSGTKISPAALSELSILPNLTDVDLSNNDYSICFDFSNLPSQITGVDLTGNELYEYPGLVNIETQENGDETVTVLHPLTKLYLPEAAKYNCNEIVAFYQNASNVDMQMENSAGSLSAYNTLREVPDADCRALLKESFSSVFDGEYIDISKRLVDLQEKSRMIYLTRVKNVEGFQYILGNKGYTGSSVSLASTDTTSIPYFKLNQYIGLVSIENIDTPNSIDLSDATNLYYFACVKNPSIEYADFSSSKTMGQRGDEIEIGSYASNIIFCGCPKLKGVTFPKEAKALCDCEFCACPSLEGLDFSQFETMYRLSLGALPASCTLKYFTLLRNINNGTTKMGFGCDEDVYNRKETKDFLDTYHSNLRWASVPVGYGTKSYMWTKNYK